LRSFQVHEQYGIGKARWLNTHSRKKKAISFPRLRIAAQTLPLEFANVYPSPSHPALRCGSQPTSNRSCEIVYKLGRTRRHRYWVRGKW